MARDSARSGHEHEVDLHGLDRSRAQRRLARTLHTARLRGASRVLAITGRGLGSPRGEPVLRDHIEAWLAGPEAARLGVAGFERTSAGGALAIRLRGRG